MLNQPLTVLKGVGEKRAKLYKKLGVFNLDALLHYYPRAYLDFSSPYSIMAAPIETTCAIKARVYKKMPEQRIRKGMSIFKIFVTDDSSDMTITYFNNKYIPESLKEMNTYFTVK